MARLIREYPATLLVAVAAWLLQVLLPPLSFMWCFYPPSRSCGAYTPPLAAWLLQLLWLLLWSAAFSFTALRSQQAAPRVESGPISGAPTARQPGSLGPIRWARGCSTLSGGGP